MRVLIADDDRHVCDLLTALVQECGHEVVAKVTSGGLEVIKSFALHQPDLTLLDVYMPRCNGLTVCHALHSRSPGTRIVLMSGFATSHDPFVENCKASAFLQKPMRFEDLRHTLEVLSAETLAA